MEYNSNFRTDLAKSIEAEDYTINKLKPMYPLVHRIEGNHKEYDIIIPEVDETIEVKRDLRAKETGNVYIEYESRNKLSGIETTTADWWFIYYEMDLSKCVCIRTEELKSLISEINPRKVPGGDKNTSWGYLIKLKDIVKWRY